MINAANKSLNRDEYQIPPEFCPVCKGPMQFTYQVRRENNLFVLFECNREQCQEKLLRKYPVESLLSKKS